MRGYFSSLFLLLILLAPAPARAVWNPFKIKGLPCDKQLLLTLHRLGGLTNTVSPRTFLKWAAGSPQKLGLPQPLIADRYQRLAAHPELPELMAGFDSPVKLPRTRLHVSGGWGNDYVFLPNLPHWRAVTANFKNLVVRLADKRGLDPLLASQIFVSDNTSIGDSGWVIAGTEGSGKTEYGTVKITYFDYDMTPDGPWPRYTYWSPFVGGDQVMFYRRPRQLSPLQAEIILEGYYSLRSSMDKWGLLPAESQTGYRFPEHEGILDPNFTIRHHLLMDSVIDAFETPEVANRFNKLIKLRNENIPAAAREMAELGRFNIPPGADPGTKAQLFYGLTILLNARPIKTVVALSPRPPPKGSEKAKRPTFEVFHVSPGWEWMADLAATAAKEWDEARGLNQGPAPEIGRDILRESYEQLGLEVVKTHEYSVGLPNGAHIMRAPVNRFLRKIIAYQLEHAESLRAEQLKAIKTILAGLKDEK